jgi:hypothetical protein
MCQPANVGQPILIMGPAGSYYIFLFDVSDLRDHE